MLYDVASFSGSTQCATSAYNIAGLPSLLLDGRQPRSMDTFDGPSSGSGTDASSGFLARVQSTLARSGNEPVWNVDQALVGSIPQVVAKVSDFVPAPSEAEKRGSF